MAKISEKQGALYTFSPEKTINSIYNNIYHYATNFYKKDIAKQ